MEELDKIYSQARLPTILLYELAGGACIGSPPTLGGLEKIQSEKAVWERGLRNYR